MNELERWRATGYRALRIARERGAVGILRAAPMPVKAGLIASGVGALVITSGALHHQRRDFHAYGPPWAQVRVERQITMPRGPRAPLDLQRGLAEREAARLEASRLRLEAERAQLEARFQADQARLEAERLRRVGSVDAQIAALRAQEEALRARDPSSSPAGAPVAPPASAAPGSPPLPAVAPFGR